MPSRVITIEFCGETITYYHGFHALLAMQEKSRIKLGWDDFAADKDASLNLIKHAAFRCEGFLDIREHTFTDGAIEFPNGSVEVWRSGVMQALQLPGELPIDPIWQTSRDALFREHDKVFTRNGWERVVPGDKLPSDAVKFDFRCYLTKISA